MLWAATESALSNHVERLHPVVLGYCRRAKDPLKITHLKWPKGRLEASLALARFPGLVRQEGRERGARSTE